MVWSSYLNPTPFSFLLPSWVRAIPNSTRVVIQKGRREELFLGANDPWILLYATSAGRSRTDHFEVWCSWALSGEVTVAAQVYRLPEQLYSRRKQQPSGYSMQSPLQEHLPQDLHETCRLDTAPQPRGASPLPRLDETLINGNISCAFINGDITSFPSEHSRI